MKKYSSLLLAFVLIVGSLGTYYVSSVIEAKTYPEFHIQTLDGDDTWLEPIVISAHYDGDSKAGVLQLTADEMIYRDHESFFEQLKGVPYSYEKRLREQYKSILRRTTNMSNNVYEDDEHIVFAKLIGDRYQRLYEAIAVDVYIKETGKIKTITADFDSVQSEIWIQEVQKRDHEWIVFTNQWLHDEPQGSHEIFQTYHFDILTGQFSGETSILAEDTKMGDYSISKLYETPYWKPNEYVVYRKEFLEESQNQSAQSGDQEEAAVGATFGELIAFEVKTGDTKTLQIPEPFQWKEVSFFDGSYLYFVDEQAGGMQVAVYHISSGEIVSEFSVHSQSALDHPPLLTVYEGNVYTLEQQADDQRPAELAIYDAETGERVYVGEVISNDEQSFRLDMYNITFNY